MPWFTHERTSPVMTAISELWHRLIDGHKNEHRALDRTIGALEESDRELDRRMKILRDQVDVYQRSQSPEAPSDGQ